ncbi:hypothetical protein [Pontiella sulfatireligans]|uniref:Uncharacterized protein n=1 Tax=Pontiella sulfatireligans TaxID=2750658 RepID=A0A6C2UPG0_9BACT|nr:hypothetical protein [Pontiella sulfatireligans]VGO21204.1 hypothetical protein SCARR_03276 [Pontiella sulfatireligans]
MSIGKAAGTLGSIWGVGGLSLVFGSALYRLYPYAEELQGMSFTWLHWVALFASLVFMGYAEGYKGFHLKFSPRCAARALYLKDNPTFIRVLFAPFFCMGYFHATRKRKIVAYSLTLMIVLLIVGVRKLEQPWRGIVDAGVLLGLGWGLVSVWIFSAKAFFGQGFDVSPETPDA